ncbi:hypothetical protein GCM10027271_42570 [Saccharopolyspora gloriosae]|uniref:Uncharacterized protein n=1 Tax=Saccharopolyspora gloriosae TaxID=455344 RepID=A0A840NQD2_9PSEU|nr:hypothetical protein [Saccharopolyspora gloriosae]MBB5070447.1 hypothetical protein [Saccharopolyspora gloriosae]
MATRAQRERWREEGARLAQAAERAREEARRGQAAGLAGIAPIVPVSRYIWVGLLDELGWAAGRGELPGGVRRLALEMAEEILAEPPD